MQKLSLLFLFVFSAFTVSSQLADYYQFDQDGEQLSLAEKMAAEQVPGYSNFLWFDDQEESLTTGQRSASEEATVSTTTLFPVGAMSEAPVLFEMLRLSDAGLIDLDAPVQNYLPELRDRRLFKFQSITIRDLILRRKTLTGPMKPHGYAAGDSWPTLSELLTNGGQDFPDGLYIRKNRMGGQSPQCGNAILLQLILENYHQQALATIMQEQVFEPLGMEHSFYATELTTEQQAQAAVGHDQEGIAIPGDYRRFPELAAAGLWTTPADYARLVLHVMKAARGEDNRFLTQATALKSVTAQQGYRSLLFHINEQGGIYWGGNTAGYFTAMQANMQDNYVMVAFCNGDLNWPLVMGSLFQSGGWIAQQRQGETIGMFTQPGDEGLSDEIVARLQTYARENRIQFVQLDASEGAPVEITATPALVFQSPRGRAVFGGQLVQWSAVENFIRTARTNPVAAQSAIVQDILIQTDGRQSIGFPLKWTAWTGEQPAGDWKALFRDQLAEQLNAAEQDEARLLPTDRRFYVDVHPYANDQDVFLSIAIFSQFDCIHPIYENFGQPVRASVAQPTEVLQQAAQLIATIIEQHWANVQAGDALYALPAYLPAKSFEELGLTIPSRSTPQLEAPDRLGVNTSRWEQVRPLSAGQPLVQFNFPSPLERYAGEVRELDGQLRLSDSKMSGTFTANLRSLTMGNAEFDAKVLRDYLRVRRFSEAVFSFEDAVLSPNWQSGTPVVVDGELQFLGQIVPLAVNARFQPSGTPDNLVVSVQFEMDIARPFGLPGPDGPEYAKEHLQFSVQFEMEG